MLNGATNQPSSDDLDLLRRIARGGYSGESFRAVRLQARGLVSWHSRPGYSAYGRSFGEWVLTEAGRSAVAGGASSNLETAELSTREQCELAVTYELEGRISPAWCRHDREIAVPVIRRLDGCDEDGRPLDLTERYRSDADFRAEVDHELERHLGGLADAATEDRAGVQ